jgi:hypothetical protein
MYSIDKRLESQQEFCQSIHLPALQQMLSDREIEAICRELGHTWRHRQLPPGVTLRSMVFRALHPDHTISRVVDHLAAHGDVSSTLTDSAWCQASARLPEALCHEAIVRKAERLQQLAAGHCLWLGRLLFRADGSTLSMPDEPDLVKAFGYANTRHGPSRFPVARITFLVLAGAEAVWDYRLDDYRCSEEAQFHDMWHRLPRGCICLCDRKFCSFYNLAKLQQRAIDVVMPLHQRRDPRKLIRNGRKIGRDDWIVPLDLAPSLRKKYDDPSLPKTLHVRLIRVRKPRPRRGEDLWLVSTLLDRRRYRRKSVAKLYRARWPIETRIGSVKTTLELAVLRSKTERNIRREVACVLLAHNLVWTLMHQAAQLTGTPPDRISFARAIGVIEEYSIRLRYCRRSQRQELYCQMLERIASHTNPYRPGRIEPRQVKRDRVRYPHLRKPRQQARQECLS